MYLRIKIYLVINRTESDCFTKTNKPSTRHHEKRRMSDEVISSQVVDYFAIARNDGRVIEA